MRRVTISGCHRGSAESARRAGGGSACGCATCRSHGHLERERAWAWLHLVQPDPSWRKDTWTTGRAARWLQHTAPPSTPHGRPRAGAGAGSGSDSASRARIVCGGGASVSSFRKEVVCAARAPRSAQRPKVCRRAGGAAGRGARLAVRGHGQSAGCARREAFVHLEGSGPRGTRARGRTALRVVFAARSEWAKGKTWCHFDFEGRLGKCGSRAPAGLCERGGKWLVRHARRGPHSAVRFLLACGLRLRNAGRGSLWALCGGGQSATGARRVFFLHVQKVWHFLASGKGIRETAPRVRKVEKRARFGLSCIPDRHRRAARLSARGFSDSPHLQG